MNDSSWRFGKVRSAVVSPAGMVTGPLLVWMVIGVEEGSEIVNRITILLPSTIVPPSELTSVAVIVITVGATGSAATKAGSSLNGVIV